MRVHLPVSESEALGSLYAALEMEKAGKHDKALKLFQHAAALAPRHPDILNHYGEFLEETQNDIMMADQLYFQALTYSPDHLGALANRERTAQIVDEMDRSNLHRIDDKRDTLSNIPDSSSSFRRAKKEAYFQVYSFIYFSFSLYFSVCTKGIRLMHKEEGLSVC
jgi:tetratricopeptide (TPR) repeat protein